MTAPPLDDATSRQILAAEPTASTWVSANAGSGKTRVLTDRVARLLLLGVPPEKVLCLTYTKAAAAEMQNRLFRRLGAWAMLRDDKLRTALEELGAEPPEGAEALRAARRLFARAIEAPGGLKIQTIHAFSAALLRRFPLEAGVAPDFTELDDRAQRLLLEAIVEEMADGPEAGLVEALALHATGEDFAKLTAEIARSRTRFVRTAPGLADWLSRFGLQEGYSEAYLLAEVFLGGEAALAAALAPVLATGGTTDQGAAAKLAALDLSAPRIATLEALEAILLTKSGQNPFTAKLGAFPTKALREGPAAALMPDLEALMQRVEEARARRMALAAARRAHALHAFAAPFLRAYEAAKQAQGALDFDDLILRAGVLLGRAGVAQWVLFRLDGGLDHILVDEAQDTSPEQWEVIRLIAEEFSAGESARSGMPRTLFVVGDVKQSIYSFQGADPDNFGRMAGHFGRRLAEVESRLIETELQHSFRSAPAILRVVDAAFARPERHAGLGGAPKHWPFHEDKPGRVDLWPPVPKDKGAEDGDWTDPVDRLDPANSDVVLAREIAKTIKALCHPETGETLPLPPQDGQPRRRRLMPGDFLVLVQRRSTLFAELIRACKAAELPIAGADRLRLGAELAVKDLAALLSFLATPEDDLSLAAALKSPLFGWSEDLLYRLAQGRAGYLWEALRTAEAPETLAVLDDLRREADYLRPYEILERVLTRHDGRRRLLARLGPEAEDGIDALLAQAMAYEQSEVPSLTGFLTWMETEDVEVKRQLATARGVVRVMTVHGAKGLEAPVVILPDTRAPGGGERGEILVAGDGTAIWATKADEAPPVIAEALDARRDRAAEERMRLLYVAMTRAESWLIVAGAGDVERGDGAWHGIVAEAMQASGAVQIDTPVGTGQRVASGDWEAGPLEAAPQGEPPKPALPAWATARAPAPEEALGPLSPSDLGGAKALPGELGAFDEAAAMRRGRLLHRLFEHLPAMPEAERPALARRLLAMGEDAAGPEEADALFAEAARILGDPAFAGVFAPEALAEVEIAARLPELGGRAIEGAIDRLILGPGRVQVIDYKSNALVPARPEEVPEGLLRQMGAYAAALAQLYPGRTVETAILWTAAPALMPLPPALIAAALGRVSTP
ncbi:MAG: double-strand break repair helicase AddA [Paracoccaceae bacterium]|nr:double-strand break repair helicase AddA [Paracoccaceae bacterium]